MWRSISLRTRLNLIFASLFALWLVADAGHVVFQASGRTRAETQSAMRLTKDFVATALAASAGDARAGARSRRWSRASRTCAMCAPVSASPSLASSIMHEANNASDAPRWFRALVNAPSEVAAIPVSLSDGSSQSIVIVADPADEIDEVWDGVRDHALVGAMMARGGARR